MKTGELRRKSARFRGGSACRAHGARGAEPGGTQRPGRVASVAPVTVISGPSPA